MRPQEEALLLLCCPLGDTLTPLSAVEFHQLAQRSALSACVAPEDELCAAHLQEMGCSSAMQTRILSLLSRRAQLSHYMGAHPELSVLTRLSPAFPQRLRRMGMHCPAAIFLKGDAALLRAPCVALVGSRRIAAENRAFAAEIGRQAAREGYVLVSGGAAGADRAAQDACIRAGGRVICVVPDALTAHAAHAQVLYCSLEGYELPFSAARALRRNAVIHALGEKTFVAQSDVERGGTWAGTMENLHGGLSEVYVFDDGSAAVTRYVAAGATALSAPPDNIAALCPSILSIFDYNF